MEKQIWLKAERKPFQGNNEAEKFGIWIGNVFSFQVHVPLSATVNLPGWLWNMSIFCPGINQPLVFLGLFCWCEESMESGFTDCWARHGKLDPKRQSIQRENCVFLHLEISHPKVSLILRWKIGSPDVQWYNTQVDFEKCVFISILLT